jgi:acetate kinase/phosphoesterase RecJ-like protein
MMNLSLLSKEIEEADPIVIVRHVRPDCDALGSQFGLKSWIKDNWPSKAVYALGEETTSQGIWPQSDKCSDEIIENSLAIVVDTATAARADDQRFLSAKRIIKVDHHPETDPYGALNFTDPKAAAACEILARWFEEENRTVSKQTAEYLYKGLLTDTLRFSTSNTTANTLKAASFLADHEIDIPALNRELFDLSMKEFEVAAAIRSRVKMEPSGFAWLIFTKEDLEKFGMSGSEARGHIDEIGHVRDFKVWAMFNESLSEEGKYEGSLRSKHAPVNDIAAKFGGGGHKNAAGVKDFDAEQLEEMKQLLSARASEY